MMAESPAERRFKKKEYGNWIKLTHGLICLAEGLRPLCETTIEEFHNTLKTEIGNKECNNTKCTYKRIRKHGSDEGDKQAERNVGDTSEGSDETDTDTKARWYIDCPNDICNKWLDGITAGLGRVKYTWKNTKVRKWPTQSWEIAKVVMGKGQDRLSSKPDKTDALGLLQLITQCKKKFCDHVDTSKAGQVIFCFYFLFNKPMP